MDDYHTQLALSKLPPRQKTVTQPQNIDSDKTLVKEYVLNAVEIVDPLDDDIDITRVMDTLFKRHVSSPVQVSDLKKARLGATIMRKDRVFAKLLLALNGGTLVSDEQLREASRREALMATMESGWGSSQACDFPEYMSKLLLLSVGVPPEVLPKDKPMSSHVKNAIDHAWKTACKAFGW